MFQVFFVVIVLVAIAGVCLSIGVIIKGKFPDTHVGHNVEMKKRGISCVKNEGTFCQGRLDSEVCRECKI